MSAAVDHGYLPSGKYIINHDIMNCTAEGVVGNHLYSGRALGLSEPYDIIQLHPALRPLMAGITEHYRRVGLSHSQKVIWGLDLRQIGSHIGLHPSVFYFGPNECKYWGDHQWLQTVEYINSKNNFMALAEELGIDVPKTRCYDKVTDICINDVKNLAYPCYLKAAVSVAGVGIYRCDDMSEFVRALGMFTDNTPVQIQEEVKTSTFLNLQYRVVGNALVRLAVSEQILDGCTYQGSCVPASHQPWDAVESMAYWLKDRGMKGIFAFDVAVVQTDRGLRFIAIECNPRFNGATYPTFIAQKLDIPEWSTISLMTEYRSLNEFDIRDLEFDMKTGEGVIIVNWGTVLVGKLVFLLAGSKEYQDVVAMALKERLC